MKPKIIYISYDGVLEPLGYSQVICYLKNLSTSYNIKLLSFEKKRYLKKNNIEELKNELSKFNIKWHYLTYHHHPRNLSTIFDIITGILLLIFILLTNKIKLIHSRSYIASFMALILSYFFGFRFIFDMRGFWIDEKSDRSGLSQKSLLYKFFKIIEKKIIIKSDIIICLTEHSKEILKKNYFNKIIQKIFVIPTCADENLFKPLKLNQNSDIVLGYIGSIDTAYDIEKVIVLFSKIILEIPNIKLKIYTEGSHNYVENLMIKYKIEKKQYVIGYSERKNINSIINSFDFGIFYLKKNFSIIASFPTKIAEFLLCGKPIICNNFNDDITKIIQNNQLGIINEFNKYDHKILINNLNKYINDSNISMNCRRFALNKLSLTNGASKYANIYKILVN